MSMAHLTPLTEEEQTLKTLRRIFHEQMSLMELHNYNTKEKMIIIITIYLYWLRREKH